jgi:uncharacterized protein DUF6580
MNRILIAAVLIVLAVVARVVPHPENFTPVLAVALFGGAVLPRRLAYLVPLAALVLGDVLLGYAFTWLSAVVYACFLIAVRLGEWLGRSRTWTKTAVAALGGSVFFYLATNFAEWAGGGLYAHTLDGLIDCYWMAIPFFRNSLAGDLAWTFALFGLYELAGMLAKRRSAPPAAPA